MSLAPVLYQETRISPTPTSPSSILQINTKGSSSQQASFGAGRKRPFDEISGNDEASFARKHLATEGSVFFRRKSRAPRSFLWRVLNDRQLLEVQCVDLVQEKKQAKGESYLTFHIALPAPILQGGVAFADPEETDALEAFVLTKSNDLYTITLKRDLLTRQTSPSNFDSSTCVKRYSPGSFSFRHPYRFVAASSLELLISLQDGGIMSLERNANENGSQWRETFFSEGGWSGTLRSLIPLNKPRTVRYGDQELQATAAAGIAKSPDGQHVWTVSLDHTLKAWSTKTGKVISQRDLLNEHHDHESQRRQAQYLMGAEQGKLLQTVKAPSSAGERAVARMDEEGRYCVVVHSPKDHQFKFYEISSTFTSIEGDALRLDDLQPNVQLKAPIDDLMNTNIWHLEEFFVQPGTDWQGSQIWLRARSGALCKVFTLTFSMFDEEGENVYIEGVWQSGWSEVDAGPITVKGLRDKLDFPGQLETAAKVASTSSERWLDFLFYPDRFSTASLETALYIYRRGRGLAAGGNRGLNASEQPLKERLTAAITSKLMLRRSPNEQPDFASYQRDIQTQWSSFYAVLEQLTERRQESLNLAYDAEQQLAWTAGADFVAPIRACDQLELLCLNAKLLIDDQLQYCDEIVAKTMFPSQEDVLVSQLVNAAHEFKRRLSAGFQYSFRQAVAVETQLYNSETEVKDTHLNAVYEKCAFSDEVADDVFQSLTDGVENLGGLGNLDNDMILAVIERLNEETTSRGRDSGESLQRYGAKLSVAVSHDMLQRQEAILLDMLALIVFMHGDLEHDEFHQDFSAVQMFDTILLHLKHNSLRMWLATRTCLAPPYEGSNEVVQMTLLESMFVDTWSAKADIEDASMPELLTAWSKRWLFQTDLHRDCDGFTAHIFATLLRHKTYEEATDFEQFLTNLPWTTYLKGRLHVAAGNYQLAAIDFKDAADGLGLPEKLGKMEFDTAQLLSPEERNYFGTGIDKYFQHVASLFEKLKVYSYTAEFADLALRTLDGGDDFEQSLADIDMRKSMSDSPAAARIEDTMEEIRLLRVRECKNELLGRLFNALVQTGRFSEAYDALVQIKDPAMQKADLQQLIQSCVTQDAVPTLLNLPLEGQLASSADNILFSLAKKNLASGSASSTPYHQILYAYRTQRADFRGAAEILYEHLERLRHDNKQAMQDPEDETLIQAYVLLINTLACCGEGEGWLLAEPIAGVHDGSRKRKLVTLDEVRREYSAELDQRSDILQGRFSLVGGSDEMDML